MAKRMFLLALLAALFLSACGETPAEAEPSSPAAEESLLSEPERPHPPEPEEAPEPPEEEPLSPAPESPDTSAASSQAEQITELVHRYFAAFQAGDSRTMDGLYRDGLFVPELEDVEQRVAEDRAFAEQTFDNIVVQSVQPIVNTDGVTAEVTAVVDIVTKQAVERTYALGHNVLQYTMEVAKVGGEWKIAGFDWQSVEAIEYAKALAPYNDLYQYLDNALTDDQHGFYYIDTPFPGESQAQPQMVIWAKDRPAVEKALRDFPGGSLQVDIRDAKYSANELINICRELEQSSIRNQLNGVEPDRRNNGVHVRVESEEKKARVLEFLKNYRHGDAVTCRVYDPNQENPLT